MTNLILLLTVGAMAVVILILFLKSSSGNKKSDQDSMQMLNQRLDGLNVSMNQALRDTVKMVADQLKDSRESVERSSRAVNQRVQGFTTGQPHAMIVRLTHGYP